jgi:hypothetical protein
MAEINQETTRATLDSLRVVRRKLFSISEAELSAMSLEDQVSYGDDLHKNSTAILRLETAKLKGVNDQFKEREEELKEAAAKLERALADLDEAVQLVRVASDGLALVTDIVELLG